MANQLPAVMSIGKAGVTDTLINSIDEYLAKNELVKISIQEGVELEAKEVCNELAQGLKAEFVQAIGRRFVLYRRARDPRNRKIELKR